MSKHLNEIIRRLGYADSPSLKYKSKHYDSEKLNAHTNKVLTELSPFAAYMVRDEPFVLFFDELSDQDEQKIINRKIWNAQIPVVIFCGTSTIKIFNGYTLEQGTHHLTEAGMIQFDAVDEIDENSPFSFWEITDQRFWEEYSQKFSGQKLNEALLENLTYLTEKLEKDHKVPFATVLVLRLIFMRYLIDRGVDLDYPGFSADVAVSREALLALFSNRAGLYKIFAHLKDKFNGNLFELDDEAPEKLTDSALKELKDFLSANVSTRSGQRSLFTLYDFNIIPVELISNIYEILLGKKAQDEDNAFYTPKYLVDYILDMTINKHIENNESCKILDPSCGSGIFLVDSYRRMIESKLDGSLYTENDGLLCDTLKSSIFGIDLNPSAIDVAIFSLYLAALDYKNPKTLKQFPLPNLRGSNLLACNFFDEEELQVLQKIPFDFIIGNPPWKNKHEKEKLENYYLKHGYKQYMQINDACRAFILRSKDFSRENTTCCFVLHAKMLYMQKTPSKEFRKYLLRNTKIESVIELSSVRKLVFKNADAPAIVLSYKFSDTNEEENRFEHLSMKRNEFFRLFNIIVLERTDVKNVQQKLLIENDWAWKTLVYGLAGDIDTIRKLKATTRTLWESIKNQQPLIIEGTGVQCNDGHLKDASHLLGRPLLNSRTAIDHFVLFENNVSLFTKEKIHSPRDEALFHAPYVLSKQGVDMADYTMRAVYSEDDFVFHDVVHAIKGSLSQKDFLLNTVGLLNSKLYAYFNLMLGSFVGIEREKRQIGEVFTFPFVFSEEVAKQVECIQTIKKCMDFFPDTDVSDEIAELNRTILEVFELSDNEFVDYALRIQIPQLTGKNDIDVRRKANVADYETYGQFFYNCLSEIFAGAGKYVQINAYPAVAKHYSAIEAVVLEEKPSEWLVYVDGKTNNRQKMLARLSGHKANEMFYSVKDVIGFDECSFYIIKPNYYKNWHPAIAKLDLMEVTDQILSRNSEREG